MKDSPKKTKKTPKKTPDLPLSPQPAPSRQVIQEPWFILPVISLLVTLLVLTVYNAALKQRITQTPTTAPKHVAVADFPMFKNNYSPAITAQSAIILDDASKVVLYEKNASVRFSMASTTKVMTALVALEHFKMKDVLTIHNDHSEGAVVGFPVGETIYFEDMLYAMLLPSGNDAAYAIAENYPGGLEAFVARMNSKAAELRMTYTRYADPAGLDDDGGYTTVHDLARLASYALQQEELAKIVATKNKTITNVTNTQSYTLENLNKLLGRYGVIGVKTGYTQGAGGVLITAMEENNKRYIIVVMRSEDRFADTEQLLALVSNNVNFVNPIDYLGNNNKE